MIYNLTFFFFFFFSFFFSFFVSIAILLQCKRREERLEGKSVDKAELRCITNKSEKEDEM